MNITDLLPHRNPILLVDRVLRYEPPDRLSTAKDVRRSEPCYAGLAGVGSPRRLAYPPTLLLESFAQSCGILFRLAAADRGYRPDGLLMLGSVRQAEFHHPVRPGQTVRHEVRLDHLRGDNALLSGASYVDDLRIATIGSAVAVTRPVAAISARPGR